MLIALTSVFFLSRRKAVLLQPVLLTNPTAPVAVSRTPGGSPSQRFIYVHIAGHVVRPGLYRVVEGSRIVDVVTAAGGAKEDGVLDSLNLADVLRDGTRIYVPSEGQAAPPEPTNFVAEPESPAPLLVRPAPQTDAESIPIQPAEEVIPPPVVPSPEETQPETRTRVTHSSNKLREPGDGFVKINSADETELCRLPGVGPSTAKKILAYRQEKSGFKTVDELMEVKGIGPAKMAKMRPFIKVE